MHWDGTFTFMLNVDGRMTLRSVDAEDILYFCVQQNQVVAHTSDEELFTGWYSLDRLWQALRSTDSRFFRTDRVYIVNLMKIRKLDRDWSKIYFTDNPAPHSKHCYVARLKLPEVERSLHELTF